MSGRSGKRALQTNRPTRIVTEQRRYRMLQMRIRGATQQTIADALGVSTKTVSVGLDVILGKLAELNKDAADEYRALQVQRYEKLLVALWERFEGRMRPDGSDWLIEPDIEAGRLLVRVLARLDAVWGLLPDKPMIDMRQFTQNNIDARQNIQISITELAQLMTERSNGNDGSSDSLGSDTEPYQLLPGDPGGNGLPEAD